MTEEWMGVVNSELFGVWFLTSSGRRSDGIDWKARISETERFLYTMWTEL